MNSAVQSFPFRWYFIGRDRFEMEISQLIERCRKGDNAAKGELYEYYCRSMRHLCRRFLDDDTAVDDVLHDAFLVILSSLDQLRTAEKADAWMRSIVRNVAIRFQMQRRRIPTTPLDENMEFQWSDDDSTHDIRGLSLDEVLHLVNQLPEGYGRVFRLSVFEGLTHKEIAAQLGIAPHSSSSQLARAKKMLRRMMQRSLLLVVLLLLAPTDLKYRTLFRMESPARKIVSTSESPIPSVRKRASRADVLPVAPVAAVPSTAVSQVPEVQKNEISQQKLVLPSLHKNEYKVQEIKSKHIVRRKFSFGFSYRGLAHFSLASANNYISMPDYASGDVSQVEKLYNWADYLRYVSANAPLMNAADARQMTSMALSNLEATSDASGMSEALSENITHECPQTWLLSMKTDISQRWRLSVGVGLTQLKSHSVGGGSDVFERRQRLIYADIPVQTDFRFLQLARWEFYALMHLQLSVPVGGRLTTRYLYRSHEPILEDETPFSTQLSVKGPWQWGAGVGLGVQYRLTPHVSFYFEPAATFTFSRRNYYRNYRTEYPLDANLPLGIRWNW